MPLIVYLQKQRAHDRYQEERAFLDRLKRDRWQKGLGILTESYEEWGKADEAKQMLFVCSVT